MLPESEDEAGVGFQECGKMPQWIHQDSVYPLLLSRDHTPLPVVSFLFKASTTFSYMLCVHSLPSLVSL